MGIYKSAASSSHSAIGGQSAGNPTPASVCMNTPAETHGRARFRAHGNEAVAEVGRNLLAIANKTDRPCPYIFVRMSEKGAGEILVEAAADVQRPERFQRQLALVFQNHFPQQRHNRSVTAFAEDAPCFAAPPAIRIVEQGDQFLARPFGQRRFNGRGRPGRPSFLPCKYGRCCGPRCQRDRRDWRVCRTSRRCKGRRPARSDSRWAETRCHWRRGNRRRTCS